jgi:hypothetical protein
METTKRLSDLDPSDRAVIERVFGQPLDKSADSVLILRVNGEPGSHASQTGEENVPTWCNVLEGLSDEDLADFDAILKTPIRLANPAA